ncbi:hypothetical protein BC826DRAFT_1110627 [Russula brevipes]|nr:hypothetical protein BC826DRAFT_1110627 [Russula brevipes]
MVEQSTTIDVLPCDVLLHVFAFHQLATRPDYLPMSVAWEWHVLVHVCRRWRCLIFESAHHLGLRLVIGRLLHRKAHRTSLACWPALPISIWYDTNRALSPDDEDNVTAALEQSDRIHEINLTMSSSMLAKSRAWLDNSFPALEHLHLKSPHGRLTAVPSSFLGRPSDTSRRLRHVSLKRISFPTLPQLLLSSHGLITLSLGPDFLVGGGLLSPEALTAALSSTTQLKHLSIHSYPNMSHPEQEVERPPPLDLIVLPSLTKFSFTGAVEYLEDLVPRIHAPLLEQLFVSFLQQRIVDVSQLSRFISRTANLTSSPLQTSIGLWAHDFTIKHCFRDTPHPDENAWLVLICEQAAWEMSEVVHVCRQLSPLVSGVRQLTINACHSPPSPEGKSSAAPWLQLLAPFDSVRELEFYGAEAPCTGFAYALERSALENAEEVLPALGVLRARDCAMQAQRSIESFAAARELSGRSLAMCVVDEKGVEFHSGTVSYD